MNSQPSKPKVLIIAEAANPEWVSVPLIGWSLSAALKDVAEIHLVTQIRNKEAIERAGWVEGIDFTAIDSEKIARPLYKIASILRMGQGKGWTIIQAFNAMAYPYFEKLVWDKFGEQIKGQEYDIVHRITPLSPTISSSLASKCKKHNVPFILGPLNGGVPWPSGFDAERRQEREWLSYIRKVYKLLPGRKNTLVNASAIITGSRHTATEIPQKLQEKTVHIPENAIDPSKFNGQVVKVKTPLTACFIGRLVPYKCPDILIDAAMPLVKSGALELDFLGDGPLMEKLKEMVEKEGVSDRIKLHGWVAHSDVSKVISRAQLFSFPSIREFGGGVVLEAMASGLVPLIVDYAGPSELVTENSGYKVPLGSRADITSAFRKKLEEIVADPSQLPALSEQGLKDVSTFFTWSQKAKQVRSIYDAVLNQDQDFPDPIKNLGH